MGGGQGAGEKGRTELWHQKNAKSTTSWKIPEGPKVEKQRREMLTVWRNREWTGDDSFTCYLPTKFSNTLSLIQLMQFWGEVTVCEGIMLLEETSMVLF